MERETFVRSANGYQTKEALPDGTIEITDTLPKPDYYKSLRRANSTSAPGSQSALNIPTTNSNTYSRNSIDRTFTRNKTMFGSQDFKPSGKEAICSILMLEGVEQSFVVDTNAYGAHLFNIICEKLELTETEYFGLTYRNAVHVDMWLKNNERISKQLDKGLWKFEFRVKYYPARPDYLKDDLTRYFLCLQIRQDIICGQLPCSFNTYVLLGAYVIQSEAGDYDPEAHEGIEYLFNVPFAPKELQTPEMLVRIAEMHHNFSGKTPEQADHLFLENARKMALYGVHLHRVKGQSGEDISLGVYHSGILIYRGRLRMQRFSWARIVKLSYKGRGFVVVVRPPACEEIDTTMLSGTIRRQRPESPDSFGGGGKSRPRSRSRSKFPSAKPQTLTFKCSSSDLAKRLYDVVIDHHAFFRLREPDGPRKPNLLPGFGVRKYHYSSRPHVNLDAEDNGYLWTLSQEAKLPPSGVHQVKRVAVERKPEQYAKSLVTLMTPLPVRKGINNRAPCASLEESEELENGHRRSDVHSNINSIVPESQMDESYAAPPPSYPTKPLVPSSNSAAFNRLMNTGAAANSKTNDTNDDDDDADDDDADDDDENPNIVWNPGYNGKLEKDGMRPELGKEHWQMSPADCTQGLGMDLQGTDVATMLEAGWQGCRTNRGIKGPGSYFYEVVVLEDGDVRLGWSTNSASLMLGSDDQGYGYGVDDLGMGSQVSHLNFGRLVHAAQSFEMGLPISVSDVIGCFLQLIPVKLDGGDQLIGNVMWAHNGRLVSPPNATLVQIPQQLATEKAFFPSASLRDARVSFNFGDRPFVHPPGELTGGRVEWCAPVQVPLSQMIHNVNAGWCINQFDTTSKTNLEVSEDGRMIQTQDSNEWQGFRANKGVFESGKYYYEVEQVENTGFSRFGWALPEGSLLVGMDNRGYAFGVGPHGSPGKKVFNGEIENYGATYRAGDVVGCFLNLDDGYLQWSLNGEIFPVAYTMDSSFITHPRTVFFPAGSLLGTTVEVNYGDRPFKFQPTEEWYPLFAAADENVRDSPFWPKDLNKALKLEVNTERVESDIRRPDVQITVERARDVSMPIHSTSIPVLNESNTSMSNDEQDTVIRTSSEHEFATASNSPPPVPPPQAPPLQQSASLPRSLSFNQRQASLSNTGMSHPPPPPIPNASQSQLIHQFSVPVGSYSDSIQVTEEDGEPEVEVDYYINEKGYQIKRIIQRHKKIVTTIRNESVERKETKHVMRDYDRNNVNSVAAANPEEELNRAIHAATNLDSENVVVNGAM